MTGMPLSWNSRGTSRPAPPTCTHERHAGSASVAHIGWWSGCVGPTSRRAGLLGRCTARHPASIASTTGAVHELGRTPRHERDREQAVVVGAEVGHGAVVRAGAAEREVEVVAEVLRRRERREHELRVEPEPVERRRPLGGVERAGRVPALLAHQVGVDDGVRVGSVAPALRGGDRVVGERARAAERERSDAVADVGVGVGLEPAGQLHQVAVGVEVPPSGRVGHRRTPCSQRAPAIVPVGRRRRDRVRRTRARLSGRTSGARGPVPR